MAEEVIRYKLDPETGAPIPDYDLGEDINDPIMWPLQPPEPVYLKEIIPTSNGYVFDVIIEWDEVEDAEEYEVRWEKIG